MNADSTDFDDLAAATVEFPRPAVVVPVTPPRSRGELTAGACLPAAPAVTLPRGVDCILSTLQCAKLLNVHASTLRRMGDDGPPRIWVTTGRVGYRLSKIYEWMDRQSRGGGAGDVS
jgi:hypothetical protein